MGNLFQQIKDSVKGQKSNFCSRSTSVTLLESGGRIPFSLVVNYTDCDGRQQVVNYRELLMNNNFIPDCVRGGSPISITDGGNDFPEQPMDTQQTSYKSFVQYGTTDCETPPPSGENKILFPCAGVGEGVVVDTTGYDLMQGGVYEIRLNPLNGGPIPRIQCFTIGEKTNQRASYNIGGPVGIVEDCNVCDSPLQTFRVLTSCNGEQFVVNTNGAKIIEGSVYQIQLSGPVALQCYTIGQITDQSSLYSIVGVYGSQLQDCSSCGGTPTPSPPKPTVTFPTSTPTPTLPTYFSYIVGNTSYKNQIDACASSGGGTITVYSSTNDPIVNSTFLYSDILLTIPYNSEGFVYYSGKGESVISTGSDGKLTSFSLCT